MREAASAVQVRIGDGTAAHRVGMPLVDHDLALVSVAQLVRVGGGANPPLVTPGAACNKHVEEAHREEPLLSENDRIFAHDHGVAVPWQRWPLPANDHR